MSGPSQMKSRNLDQLQNGEAGSGGAKEGMRERVREHWKNKVVKVDD